MLYNPHMASSHGATEKCLQSLTRKISNDGKVLLAEVETKQLLTQLTLEKDFSEFDIVFPCDNCENELFLMNLSYAGRSLKGLDEDIRKSSNPQYYYNIFESAYKNKQIRIEKAKYVIFATKYFISTADYLKKLNGYEAGLNRKDVFSEYILVNPIGRDVYECEQWEKEVICSFEKAVQFDEVLEQIANQLKRLNMDKISAINLLMKWEINRIVRFSLTENFEYHSFYRFSGFEKSMVHHGFSKSPEFKIFRIVVSNKCDLSCRYCYYSDIRNRDTTTMTKQQIRDALNHIRMIAKNSNQKEVCIQWWGGDPACCEDLVIFGTEEAKRILGDKVKVKFGICSSFVSENTQHFFDYLVENDFQITISCDGYKELNNHNKKLISPSGENDSSFNRIMRSFDYLSKKINSIEDEINNKTSSHKAKIKFRCTLCKDDEKNYDKVCDFFQKLKYSFRICSVSDANTAKSKKEFHKNMIQQYRKAQELILKTYKNGGGILDLLPIYCNAHTNPLGNCRFIYSRCGFGGGIFIINVDNKIYTCHRFNGINEFCVGEVGGSYESLVEKTVELRKRWLLKYDKCFDCEKQAYCTGGCAYEAYCSCDSIWKTVTCPSESLISEKVITNYIYKKLFPQLQNLTLNVEQCHTVRNIWC